MNDRTGFCATASRRQCCSTLIAGRRSGESEWIFQRRASCSAAFEKMMLVGWKHRQPTESMPGDTDGCREAARLDLQADAWMAGACSRGRRQVPGHERRTVRCVLAHREPHTGLSNLGNICYANFILNAVNVWFRFNSGGKPGSAIKSGALCSRRQLSGD